MKHQTKTIGLIGGMGWESSKRYYELLNKRVNKLLGGSHSAKIILVSVDFAEIEQLTHANDWKGIERIVVDSARQLERSGANMVLLCSNLIHIVSDKISEALSIPFFHIADATGQAIQEQNIRKVLLLGTRYTMEENFYSKILEDVYGLTVVIPKEPERNRIHQIIYNELLKDVFSKSSKQEILTIIQEAQQNGIEGVILGCTELPMLIKHQDADIPIFDTGYIHVNKAVEKTLSGLNTIKKNTNHKKQKGTLSRVNNFLIMLFTRYLNSIHLFSDSHHMDNFDIGKTIIK